MHPTPLFLTKKLHFSSIENRMFALLISLTFCRRCFFIRDESAFWYWHSDSWLLVSLVYLLTSLILNDFAWPLTTRQIYPNQFFFFLTLAFRVWLWIVLQSRNYSKMKWTPSDPHYFFTVNQRSINSHSLVLFLSFGPGTWTTYSLYLESHFEHELCVLRP